jgi:hypothetical protein
VWQLDSPLSMTRTRESLGGLDLGGWAAVDRNGGSGVDEFRAVQHRVGDSNF